MSPVPPSVLTGEIIGAAIEVHREMGPGLMESIYEWCLLRELSLRGLRVEQQCCVPVSYKGATRDEVLRCDLLVEGKVLVEVKAVDLTLAIHRAQVLSYLKLLRLPFGLLINFNAPRLVDGVSRLILKDTLEGRSTEVAQEHAEAAEVDPESAGRRRTAAVLRLPAPPVRSLRSP